MIAPLCSVLLPSLPFGFTNAICRPKKGLAAPIAWCMAAAGCSGVGYRLIRRYGVFQAAACCACAWRIAVLPTRIIAPPAKPPAPVVKRVNGMAYYQRGDCVPCDAGCLDVGGCDSCDLGAPDACHCDTKSRACDTLGDYANACPCDACDAMDCGRKEEEREPKKKPIRMPNLR